MAGRRDALCAAAEAVLAVEGAARQEQAAGTVGTVGSLTVEPGRIFIIPGRCALLVDIRSVDGPSRHRVLSELERRFEEIAAARAVAITTTVLEDAEPVPFAAAVVEALGAECRERGIRAESMPSRGGHDAQHFALFTDAAMLFIPCRDGISHAPEEFAELEDICLAAEILAGTLARLAGAPVAPASGVRTHVTSLEGKP
jgi:hydantoinase/carbamoylase family amidase